VIILRETLAFNMWFAKTETVETAPPEPTPQEQYEECCKKLAAAGIELKAAEYPE
jgi:hypothetical protein